MENEITLPQCMVKGSYLPQYAHIGDAGADLRSSEEIIIPARGKKSVPTGLCIALPRGHVGLIWPRSGLAFKHSIDCGAGVIDVTFRGEIQVLLFNHSDNDYLIKKGQRIAQLLIQKIEPVNFVQVTHLEATTRGYDGFGSTGR